MSAAAFHFVHEFIVSYLVGFGLFFIEITAIRDVICWFGEGLPPRVLWRFIAIWFGICNFPSSGVSASWSPKFLFNMFISSSSVFLRSLRKKMLKIWYMYSSAVPSVIWWWFRSRPFSYCGMTLVTLSCWSGWLLFGEKWFSRTFGSSPGVDTVLPPCLQFLIIYSYHLSFHLICWLVCL